MHRSVQPLARLIAWTAVPAVLVTGCSVGFNAAKNGQPASAANPTSSPAPAKYRKLPDPCTSVSQDMVKQLVPSAKDTAGKPVTSTDANSRGGCSWTGLDGYQYRWLDDSLQRFDTIAAVGSGEDQAKHAYQLAVQTTTKAPGATTAQVAGLGDEASVITWDQNKDNTDYHYATVVARSANVVVTVDFSGAGLQGDNKPKADEMNRDAQLAAKDILDVLR